MTLDWAVVWQHRDALLVGTRTTILLTFATMAIALPCGALVAVLRLYGWEPVRAVATAYVEFFRNLPLILDQQYPHGSLLITFRVDDSL